jgi:hypothetical protein
MARVIRVAEEVVEVYVNMPRVIKDIVKSTSFPAVKTLSELDNGNWEDITINWESSISAIAAPSWTDSQDTRRKFAFDPERLRVS